MKITIAARRSDPFGTVVCVPPDFPMFVSEVALRFWKLIEETALTKEVEIVKVTYQEDVNFWVEFLIPIKLPNLKQNCETKVVIYSREEYDHHQYMTINMLEVYGDGECLEKTSLPPVKGFKEYGVEVIVVFLIDAVIRALNGARSTLKTAECDLASRIKQLTPLTPTKFER